MDFLTLIHESRFIKGNFFLLPRIRKHQLPLDGIERIACRGGNFLDDVTAQRQVVQRRFAIFVGGQGVGDNIAFLIKQAAVRGVDCAVRVDAIGRAREPACFIMKDDAAVRHIRASEHFAFLGDLQSGGLFIILDENGYAVAIRNIHRKNRFVQAIAFRGFDFADI